jgi:hypothetical protein
MGGELAVSAGETAWRRLVDERTHNLPVAKPAVSGAVLDNLRVSQPCGWPSWSAKIIGDRCRRCQRHRHVMFIRTAYGDMRRAACCRDFLPGHRGDPVGPRSWPRPHVLRRGHPRASELEHHGRCRPLVPRNGPVPERDAGDGPVAVLVQPCAGPLVHCSVVVARDPQPSV